MSLSPERQLTFYERLSLAWKPINETSPICYVHNMALDFIVNELGFECAVIFVQDEDNGLFKVDSALGYENFPEQQKFLDIVQLLLSGEVVEHLRLTGHHLIHSADTPCSRVEKLSKSLFMEESLFQLFGGDVEVPYAMVVVGNRSSAAESSVNDKSYQVSLSNLFAYLSNSVNNILFYQAWNQERDRLTDNIAIRTQELQQQKDNFEAIYKTSKEGIAVLDVHTSAFLEANPAYIEMTGYSLDELKKTSCLALTAPEDFERSKQVLNSILEIGFLTDFVKSCLVKDQLPITVNMSLALMKDKERVLVTAKDVSEQKRLEKELLEAKLKAEDASRIKSQFLANISHEIRTPINGILGLSELAAAQTAIQPQKRYFEKIQYSAKSLISIVNDVLDFSKIEAGKMSLLAKDFDLFDTIDSTVEMLELETFDKGLDFIVCYQPGMPHQLHGDALRLSQVLTNLLSNAIKYTHQGHVKLQMSYLQNHTFRFEVIDSGIGMTESETQQIFNSFYQADSSHSRKFQGAGLGLVISKELVELMGGSINVSSEPGSGSHFYFDIHFEVKSAKPPNAFLQGKRILLADESYLWRKEMALRVAHFGADVNVIDGLAGVSEKLQSDIHYDVLFLDSQLLNKADIQVTLKTFQAQMAESACIILLTTGVNNEALLAKAREVGVTLFLEKILSPNHLQKLCKQACVNGIQQANHFVAAKQPQHTMDLADKRILLAEDNVINQDVMLGLLKSTGVNIDIAENGLVALQKFQQNQYDMILMDIQMPLMDGLEATKEIRKLDKKIPIIAITANVAREDIENCLAVGINDQINKPVDLDLLLSQLTKYLQPRFLKTNIKDINELDESLVSELKTLDRAVLNVEQGLSLMGGKNGLYLKTLRNFVSRYQTFSLNEHNAVIELHTLKGLSASIGANVLRDIVMQAEESGQNKFADVHAHLKELLSQLDTVLNSFSLQAKAAELEYATPEVVNDCFTALQQAASKSSSLECRKLLGELSGYRLEESDIKRLNLIKSYLYKRRYQDIVELCMQ